MPESMSLDCWIPAYAGMTSARPKKGSDPFTPDDVGLLDDGCCPPCGTTTCRSGLWPRNKVKRRFAAKGRSYGASQRAAAIPAARPVARQALSR
jgi:hypothetical protein